MTEWPLVFLGGLLGSSHCVGMCGGFALILGLSGSPPWRLLGRQLAYSAGRLFTYAVLGAVAGFLGTRLSQLAGGGRAIGAALSLLAGAFLIVEGLAAAGIDVRRARRVTGGPATTPCSSTLLGPLLRTPGASAALCAGLLNGLLPCGLVYAFLSLAASTSSMIQGLGLMAVFGLGTVPLMLAVGMSGSLISLAVRRRLMLAAAWCVVATGLLTVVRGAWVFAGAGESDVAACPFCAAEDVAPAPSRQSERMAVESP